MKSFLKTVILLFICNYSFSQITYSHYLDGTSEWRYKTTSAEPVYFIEIYRTIFFDGTENYNGVTYYREKFFTEYKYYNVNTLEFLFNDNYYPTIYNFVREDNLGRFYRRNYNNITVEEMYQDNQPILNSTIGATFPSLPDFNFGTCVVQSIQQLNIAGLNLKRLLGNNAPYGGLVEGIGPIGQGCNADGDGLVCYTKQEQNLLFEANADCTVFPIPVRLNNEIFNKKLVSLYPNPTSGIVNIDSNEAIKQIVVTDLQGRTMQVVENVTSCNLSSYPKGIYLLKIVLDQQIKIIKIIRN